jgi:hypothetical protein
LIRRIFVRKNWGPDLDWLVWGGLTELFTVTAYCFWQSGPAG